jgi:hypothetical protein
MRAVATLLVAVTFFFPSLGPAAAAPDSVGSVRTVQGSAFILRNGQSLPAQVGQKLFQLDTLETGADGSVGVTFRDDTRLSLGNDSAIQIDEFVFAPAQGKLAIVIRMLRGVAAYVSGKIAELSPDSARVVTPVATVGIRGTRFVAKVVEE